MTMGMSAQEEKDEDTQFHVLAVDDSVIDRKFIERFLIKTSSFQVTAVDSGRKALEFLGWEEDDNRNNPNEASVSPKNNNNQEVDLVITDYCMPGMTGYDLLKTMKESSSLRHIPVVIMSSENVPSRITRCLEEGAEEFLLKPVKESDGRKEESAEEEGPEIKNNNQRQSNKWKVMADEGRSVDRTRPQLGGLTVLSN